MATDKSVTDLNSVLNSLRSQHERLTRQISTIQGLLSDMGAPIKRGPGRPRKNAIVVAAPVAAPAPAKRGRPAKKAEVAAAPAASAPAGQKKRKKPNWTPEARKAAAERMREIWASRRKGR
jgi:pyruvate/2-oxoglutarate dehydrogenase complex dihydrolipoamide acyltransferase (E2) component